MTAMRALTIRQPWASDVVAGYRTIENRLRDTRYRGPLLIHSARRTRKADVHLPHGAVIGVVNLTGTHVVRSGVVAPEGTPLAIQCCLTSSGALSVEQYARQEGFPDVAPAELWHWEFESPRPLPIPINWPGRESLWIPPPELLNFVLTQLSTFSTEPGPPFMVDAHLPDGPA